MLLREVLQNDIYGNQKKTGLVKEIKTAFKNVSESKDVVIIEGTGHAAWVHVLTFQMQWLRIY